MDIFSPPLGMIGDTVFMRVLAELSFKRALSKAQSTTLAAMALIRLFTDVTHFSGKARKVAGTICPLHPPKATRICRMREKNFPLRTC
jgi:hypothetical protein